MVFVKWWPDDVLMGASLLTWQSELTWRRILDNIYTTDNNLFDDENTWKILTSKFDADVNKIKEELIRKNKIYIEDGKIRNKGCDKWLTEAKLNHLNQSEKGKKGANARWNGTGNAQAMPSTNHKLLTINYNKIQTIWNDTIPTSHIKEMNETRKKLFKVRYKHYFKGTEKGWQDFCTRISKIGFLWGNNDRSWKADFNWVLNENNLLKIVEGKYEPDSNSATSNVSLSQENYNARITMMNQGKVSSFLKSHAQKYEQDIREAVTKKDMTKERAIELGIKIG